MKRKKNRMGISLSQIFRTLLPYLASSSETRSDPRIRICFAVERYSESQTNRFQRFLAVDRSAIKARPSREKQDGKKGNENTISSCNKNRLVDDRLHRAWLHRFVSSYQNDRLNDDQTLGRYSQSCRKDGL